MKISVQLCCVANRCTNSVTGIRNGNGCVLVENIEVRIRNCKMNIYAFALMITLVAVIIALASIDRVIIVGLIIRAFVEVPYDFFGDQQTHVNTELRADYDFIVVGAGTAGCVLANRLSENPNWKVLLIEAGPEQNTIMDVPMFVGFLQLSNRINWKYFSERSESEYCLSMNNNQCHLPRGKLMGGSSVLNYMIYTRGNRRDYDRWAALGNGGWSFEDVRPYFEKFENNTTPEADLGVGGPVTISYPSFRSQTGAGFIKGAVEMGLPERHYNGEQQGGVSYLQTTTKQGFRVSSSRAYIDPVRKRANLHISTMSHVTKVIVDPVTKQATGVQLLRDNKLSTVTAKKEIILSAGAIGSPQLLMLSGIGPADQLLSVKIQPIVDLPGVGENLIDHISPGYFQFTVNVTRTTKMEIDDQQSWSTYFKNGSGILGMPGGCETIAFFDSTNFSRTDSYPDVEFLGISGGMHDTKEVQQNLALKDKDFYDLYEPLSTSNAKVLSIGMFVLRPRSRGHIRLRDSKPSSYPMITPNYYSDPDDVATILRAIRLMEKLEHTEAFRQMNATLLRTTMEGCNALEYGSDDYWECYVRHLTYTIYHYSGTCKMGGNGDKMAVVNPRLRVRGVKGLRVVDASIMPELVSGHPNAAVFMIGEKAAAMIKEDWL